MQFEPRVGCGAAIIRDGRILLIQRLTPPEAGAWGLPGGKIDLFEEAATATQREIEEEIGLAIEPRELLCCVDQIDRGAGTHWVAPVFLIEGFSGTPTIREPAKHGGLGWFVLEELASEITTPTRVAVAALLRRAAE
ncbi:NUDIX domain-containing protein [Consotaella salsifontis]|uniref:ADP-ribose pyrophosphatase YjhB, NUDIX family n=1 Tax=Consotaella salsifontis TaxID=1365950 RepID=A0A1T4NKU1_9HYPH|nr:NUDIX domain-containing protein [Consotaella salsifontis]SJZ79647.1 ADP-ribose pyrophosphatase YjhB, NUDIX family [Consotaella salsifontis]